MGTGLSTGLINGGYISSGYSSGISGIGSVGHYGVEHVGLGSNVVPTLGSTGAYVTSHELDGGYVAPLKKW